MKPHVFLHPKHGINPTIAVCAWCGEDRGEVAMLGRSIPGQALQRTILDYMPCETCKADMQKGIAFIEVDSAEKLKRPPLAPDGTMSVVAPTGRWLVLSNEAFEKLPLSEESKNGIVDAGRCILEVGLFEAWFGKVLAGMEESRNGQYASDVVRIPGGGHADTDVADDRREASTEPAQPEQPAGEDRPG